jgi:hypothetical protein
MHDSEPTRENTTITAMVVTGKNSSKRYGLSRMAAVICAATHFRSKMTSGKSTWIMITDAVLWGTPARNADVA